MKPYCLIAAIALCVTACQKDLSNELENNEVDLTDSAAIDAIYMHLETEGITYLEDSVVFRERTNRVDEVHYLFVEDSSTISYQFDGGGKLAEITCPEGIFDPAGLSPERNPRKMTFSYDASGELSRIGFDYLAHAPSTTWYEFSKQGQLYTGVMYDTSASIPERKIAYYRLNSERFIEKDSTIYIDDSRLYTVCHSYTYNSDNNVTQLVTRAYGNGILQSMNTTVYTRHAVENPYELARKKTYANLANWFPFSAFFSGQTYLALNTESPRGLVNSYTADEYVYLSPVQHYQITWQSTIATKDGKVIGRSGTMQSTGTEPWTFTERFYHRD